MCHRVYLLPCLCVTVSMCHRVYVLPCLCVTVSRYHRVYVSSRLCVTVSMCHRVYVCVYCTILTLQTSVSAPLFLSMYISGLALGYG